MLFGKRMRSALVVIEVLAGILMTGAILLQQRGSGIGTTFGGGGHLYAVRRGAEKVLFVATIVLAVTFFASAIALTLLSA